MNIYGRNLFAFLLHYVFSYGMMNPGSCNFNSNLCGWTQDQYDRWTWDSDGGQRACLYLKSYDGQVHRALLESVPVEARGAQCLTLEYKSKKYVKRSGYSGVLNISFVKNGYEQHIAQVQEGNYDNEWQTLSLNIVNVQKSMNVKIRFSASVAYWDDMYLDTIQLLNGSCAFECNFEENLCGASNRSFQRKVYDGFINIWSDHNFNKGGRYYLNLERKNTSAALENINFLLYDFQCLTFWYWVNEYTSTVKVLVEDSKRRILQSIWEIPRARKTIWRPATVAIEVFNQTMVEIHILGITGIHPGRIGLDNIAITSGSCLDCDFHDGFCNWDPSSDWKITRNGSKIAYPECNGRNESTLISRSEVFQGEKCLSLLYYLKNDFKMYIEVRFNDGVMWNQIWDNRSEKQIGVWTTTHINITLMNKSRIAIIVTHSRGCSDTYFIRRISMKQGRCQEHTTSSVPVTTFTTKYNASYNSFRSTTTTRKSTSTTFSTATTTTTTTTTVTTTASTTESANRTNEHKWENSGFEMKEEDSSSQVSVGGIIGIVIGCIIISGAASLVAVYMYRRRLASDTRTKTTGKRPLTNRTRSGMLKRENEDKSITSSTEQNEKRNPTSESAYYNVQAEYATVEKKQLRQNHNVHKSGSDDVIVYSLAGSLPDEDCNNVSQSAEVNGINREDVNTENNYQYDTTYETRESLSDSTYNHTNVFQDDAYASTIPSAVRPLDETYDHPERKSTLDPIYTNTFIDEGTHNTTIESSDQDFDHTYNNKCTVVDDDDCTITHTTTKDADICNHTL